MEAKMIRVKSGVEHNPIGASLAAAHPGLRFYTDKDKGSNQAPQFRVEHFAIFDNLVFAITSKILKILTDNIGKVCSLKFNLYLISI